jgi:AcrR family transcriptional regulator
MKDAGRLNEPRRRKSAAARKAEIVDTAIRLSAEMGPDRVTTQHLADAVGVTQPAIFRHFATKADIWLAVADRIVSEMNDLHALDPTNAADPHAALHRVIGNQLAHVTDNPAIPAILFSRELHAENTALQHKFSAAMTQKRDTVAGLLRRGQEAGQHRAELVAPDAAALVLAAVNGLYMRWTLEKQGFDLVYVGGRIVGGLIDSFLA